MFFYFGRISRTLIHVNAAAVRWVLFKPWVSNLQTARFYYTGRGHIFRLYVYFFVFLALNPIVVVFSQPGSGP